MGMIRRFAVATATISAAALLAVGCGQAGTDGGGSGGGDGGEGEGPRVGLVTDIGGLNDRSFNFLASKGLERAEEELDAETRVIESKSDADYISNLGEFTGDEWDLAIGVGFLMGDAIKDSAERAPDNRFAIVDFSYGDETPDNVVGMVFSEQEAGYLAGVLAGAVMEEGELEGLNDQKKLSVVGGMEIPPVQRYIVGFEAGVESQCPDCEVLVAYSQDFVDQSKCQDRALAHIDQGASIVFQVAGQCGLGALEAAERKGVWGIGVDADQAHLGDHILTSAMKQVDTAVFTVIEQVANDEFEGGTTLTFGLEEEGVGLGEIAEPAQDHQELVDETRQKIIDGEVEVPTVE